MSTPSKRIPPRDKTKGPVKKAVKKAAKGVKSAAKKVQDKINTVYDNRRIEKMAKKRKMDEIRGNSAQSKIRDRNKLLEELKKSK